MYDGYPSYIQRCDAARYFIVYHHGGVYVDLDIECFRPFASAMGNARVVFSYKQVHKKLKQDPCREKHFGRKGEERGERAGWLTSA